MRQPLLSFWVALFINLNILIGTGAFTNTYILSYYIGMNSSIVYIIGGLLMLPLIIMFLDLQYRYPTGTLYTFGATFHPSLGFLITWSYYIGKLGSAAFGIQLFSHLIIRMIPWMTHAFLVQGSTIMLYALFLIRGMRLSSYLQYIFIALKAMPILLTIAFALHAPPASSQPMSQTLPLITAFIPFVLFAFAGFEASCALSPYIQNKKKNAPRAIISAFMLALIITTIFQLNFNRATIPFIAETDTIFESFTKLIETYAAGMHSILRILTFSGIAASSLGASYSLFISTMWNLHALADNKALPGSTQLARTNAYGMPTGCLALTTLLTALYLLFFYYTPISLQQLGIAGSLATYLFITVAWWRLSLNKLLPALAGFSSLLLFYAAIKNAVQFGMSSYLIFISIVSIGLILYIMQQRAQIVPQTEE